MNEPATSKIRNTLRKTFRQRRTSLSQSEQDSAALGLVEQAKASGLCDKSQHIAVYITNDGELNTRPLIEYLWAQNKQVYLPILHPFSKGHLLFLRYNPNTLMCLNEFGIAEPTLDVTQICPLQNLDLIFTPLVAFDQSGNRLGMGGGFYDRTLAPLNKSIQHNQSITLVGLAHDIQKTVSLPSESWDIPLPHILTPSQLYTFTREPK